MFFIAGCAAPTRAVAPNHYEDPLWRGRLAVRIESLETRSFTAEFELSGNVQSGELTLFTPFGSTAATLSWTSETAVMRASGDVKNFDSLNALIKQTVGTEIPISALFAWLEGVNVSEDGWSADLTQHASGRITARRMKPEPAVELRLVLEK